MTATKEREDFIVAMFKEFPQRRHDDVMQLARLLLRHAKTHGRLSEESCNGHPCQGSMMPADKINALQERWDARIERETERIEKRIKAICEPFGIVPDFGGDPRGYTVKLHLPSKRYNTWGGEESGYGIPQ